MYERSFGLRRWPICIGALLVITLPGSLCGWGYVKEIQRENDAFRAFEPIVHLRCEIFSQPIAFHRYCRYVVDFPPGCALTDNNVHDLRSLNKLPSSNVLDVTIRTRRVTDESLPELMAISTWDLLDLTETSVSDKSIQQLQFAFPHVVIPTRRAR